MVSRETHRKSDASDLLMRMRVSARHYLSERLCLKMLDGIMTITPV